MTFEERYLELKEQSDNYERKSMIRFHFLRHLKEVRAEAYEDIANLIENIELGKGQHDKHGYVELIRTRAKEPQ